MDIRWFPLDEDGKPELAGSSSPDPWLGRGGRAVSYHAAASPTRYPFWVFALLFRCRHLFEQVSAEECLSLLGTPSPFITSRSVVLRYMKSAPHSVQTCHAGSLLAFALRSGFCHSFAVSS